MNGVEKTSMFNTLLVEDNVCYRQALSDVLLSYFPLINVEEAADGEEALSKVEYRRPHLILMDIQLPGPLAIAPSTRVRIFSIQASSPLAIK